MIDERCWQRGNEIEGDLHSFIRLTRSFSGEGTLTVYNVRKKKLQIQSELMDSDLTACRIVKVSPLHFLDVESER